MTCSAIFNLLGVIASVYLGVGMLRIFGILVGRMLEGAPRYFGVGGLIIIGLVFWAWGTYLFGAVRA